MARFRTTFLSSEESGLTTELECYSNVYNRIVISIEDTEKHNEKELKVSLDVSTAIKLSKTLRTEINKAKEGGERV